MQTPKEIIDSLNYVFEYAPEIDKWIVLKRELLSNLPSQLRSLFSTRHPLSKRTWTNEMELELASIWEGLTGRPIIFKDDEGKPRSEVIT